MWVRFCFMHHKALSVLIVMFLVSPAMLPAGELLDCIMEPNARVNISSEVPGIIEEMAVERGDHVKVGAPIVFLKSGTEKSAVALARARLEFGLRKVERSKDLVKKELISVDEMDELETENRISELDLHQAEERLNMRVIRSPVEGIVVERFLSPGEYVNNEPILTIASIAPLNVEVIAPVARMGEIKKGMRAEVLPEWPLGKIYVGKVVIVDQVADAASGTFGVRVELANRRHKIPAGVKCQIRFLRN